MPRRFSSHFAYAVAAFSRPRHADALSPTLTSFAAAAPCDAFRFHFMLYDADAAIIAATI